MITDVNIQKPKKVSFAINIIIISLVLGFINSIISQLTTNLKNYSSGEGLFITILTLAIMIFFVYKINARKKWAMTTYLVLSILGFLALPFTLITLFLSNLIVGIISSIQTILQIIALVMLYSKESREWFNIKK